MVEAGFVAPDEVEACAADPARLAQAIQGVVRLIAVDVVQFAAGLDAIGWLDAAA